MGMIIAVLAIITFFVVLHDRKVESGRINANYEKNMRKTNAKLERMTVDHNMRLGMTFDEAYDAASQKMISLGFSPCIPRSAYGTNYHGRKDHLDPLSETSYLACPERFDSEIVKRRQRDSEQNLRPGGSDIYDNFPTNAKEYEKDLRISTLYNQAFPVGDWITFPGLGMCEILGYRFDSMTNKPKGTYVVRVISTGETIQTIKIGDNKIRHVDEHPW